jgi:hypothetical protein
MSINFSNVYSVLNSFGYTRALTAFKADDDAARQGHNIFIAALSQLGQTAALFSQVKKLEEVSGQSYLSGKVQIWIYLSIPLVSVGQACIDKCAQLGMEISPFFNKSVVWLHGNIGSICQIASVVTSVTLLQLGYQAYAVTALSILALGYLERWNYLPTKVRAVYLRLTPWIGNVGLLISGGWLSRGFAVINLYGNFSSLFVKPVIPYDKLLHTSHLNFEQFNRIIAGKAILKVNREHVLIAPFPVVKNLDFNPLRKLCDTFNWNDSHVFSQLEDKLAHDARWMGSEEYQRMSKTERHEEIKALKIEYAKSKFKTLISVIEHECIETGQPLNYGILKNYLGYIAEKLPRAEKNQQIQILLQLAVEGGDYCGPGVYYQLETAATALLLGSSPQQENDSERPRLPLKQRILLILQQERLKVVAAFHLLVSKVNLAVNTLAGGDGDPHAMNRTIQMLATHFGLPDQGAQHDMTAIMSSIEKYYFRHLLGMHPEHLWTGGTFAKHSCEGYTIKRITATIQDYIALPIIPTADIRSWALQWVENLSISEKEKEAFIDQLQDGETFESHLKFRDAFIQAMLVDMNILRIEA